MTFYPGEDEIAVKTYSPYSNSYETDADSQFTVPYEMEGGAPFAKIGTAIADGGETVAVPWADLNADTTYEWYATATDANGTAVSPSRSFTTAATL